MKNIMVINLIYEKYLDDLEKNIMVINLIYKKYYGDKNI